MNIQMIELVGLVLEKRKDGARRKNIKMPLFHLLGLAVNSVKSLAVNGVVYD
jgi:hypothetical protein